MHLEGILLAHPLGGPWLQYKVNVSTALPAAAFAGVQTSTYKSGKLANLLTVVLVRQMKYQIEYSLERESWHSDFHLRNFLKRAGVK